MPVFMANLARIFRELADVLERFPITTEDPGAAIPAEKNSGTCPRSDGEETPDPSA